MRNARYWTGVAILMTPLLGLVVLIYADQMAPWPSVEGRVMYRGRPVTRGAICLTSEDRDLSSDMVTEIGRDGRFTCRPRWWLAGSRRLRYRILLFPDPRGPGFERDLDGGDLIQGVEPVARRRPAGDESPEPGPRIVRASLGSPESAPPASEDRPGRHRDAGASRMEVSIGPEAVQLNIDLKD